MQALIFILTDENPQIRFFMQNQNVLRMLGKEVGLQHYELNDANDTVLLKHVFERITDQVLSYRAITDTQAKSTENLDKKSFIERDGVIPSPYPGGDFVLTEV